MAPLQKREPQGVQFVLRSIYSRVDPRITCHSYLDGNPVTTTDDKGMTLMLCPQNNLFLSFFPFDQKISNIILMTPVLTV